MNLHLPPAGGVSCVQSVHAYIRCWMTSAYGESAAQAVRIQYGGSVTPDTVDAIMEAPDVDGA